VRDKIQQIAVAADDRVGLSDYGQRQELVVIRITRGASGCSSIFVPERQLDQRAEERVPALRLAIPVELGSVQAPAGQNNPVCTVRFTLRRAASTSGVTQTPEASGMGGASGRLASAAEVSRSR
jgi:hypothetical protein